jgi:hypothetical protein
MLRVGAEVMSLGSSFQTVAPEAARNPHQPKDFNLPTTSCSKVHKYCSVLAAFGRPGVCSNHTAPALPATKYEPHTCPHSKVIKQSSLPSLYNSTSLI